MMKNNQSQDNRPLHQTVAEGFEFKTGTKSIAVEFTDQKLSAHAGSAVFWAWLHGARWGAKLAEHLPHRASTSNNHLTAVDKALAFTHGLLCEARKLTHVAYFRRDSLQASHRQEPICAVSGHCGGGASNGCHRVAKAIRLIWTRRGCSTWTAMIAPGLRRPPDGRARHIFPLQPTSTISIPEWKLYLRMWITPLPPRSFIPACVAKAIP